MSTSHADLFVPFESGTYLLNHSVGRPLKSTQHAVNEGFLQPWQTLGEDLWPRWLEMTDAFRSALARLLNAVTEDFCPQTNLSSALSKLIYSLPGNGERKTIVLTEEDFPSMGFVLSQARKTGFDLRFLPKDSNYCDPDAWRGAIDETTCCVLITHVHSNTSAKVPVAEICRIARNAGAYSLVDIAQSVGVVPIDLQAWRADFVLGSCVKWLCGGPGAGFLWANPDVIDSCNPVDVGWFSHEDPFEFNIHNFRFAQGALKFWGGTPSVLPYVVAANSINTLSDIGIETIRAHNLAMTRLVLDAVDPTQIKSRLVDEQRGGTLVLHAGEQQAQVESRLREASILFDTRPTGIRLSPHIYNSAEEIQHLLAVIGS